MKQEKLIPEEFEPVELGSVSEETRGSFGLAQENGELPFTRQIV